MMKKKKRKKDREKTKLSSNSSSNNSNNKILINPRNLLICPYFNTQSRYMSSQRISN